MSGPSKKVVGGRADPRVKPGDGHDTGQQCVDFSADWYYVVSMRTMPGLGDAACSFRTASVAGSISFISTS
jgi:hypothetical protein